MLPALSKLPPDCFTNSERVIHNSRHCVWLRYSVYSVTVCILLQCVFCYSVYSVTVCILLQCVFCYSVYSVTVCIPLHLILSN